MAGLLSTDDGMSINGSMTYPGLDFEEGTFTFIAGRSGCGKSTYLRILNRTAVPDSGHIWYRGRDAADYPVLEYRREVALVPQEVFLFDGTIRDNFRRYSETRGSEVPSDEDIARFMGICEADFPLDADCGRLSVGERQRVFTAVFLSFMPSVLLLDEPTAALDERTADSMLRNIKSFCRENGMTVICVCHSEQLIGNLADRTVRLGARR